MESWGLGRRWRYGVQQAVGLGLLAGLLELVILLTRAQQPLGFADLVGLGLVSMVANAVLAGLVAAALLPVHSLRADQPAFLNLALQLGLTSGLLLAVHLVPPVSTLVAEGRPFVAAAMAIGPLGLAGVVYLNARYWLARKELGRDIPVAWNLVAAGGALVGVLVAAVVFPQRHTGGGYALETDPPILLVTTEGLRADALSAQTTPRLWALAEQGARFEAAITPATASVPAHGALLTGLHPLRLRTGDDLHPLQRGFTSIAELLQDEGYATAAFVSTVALATDSGLSQGFHVYDDQVGWLGAAERLRGVDLATRLVGTGLLGPVRRDGDATVDAFARWLPDHADVPFFAWVHLADGWPTPEGEAADASTLDAQLGRVLDLLDAHGVPAPTIVVAGVRGVMRGELGTSDPDEGLFDPLVRVPLVLVHPDAEVAEPVVSPQVRLMDVAPTLAALLSLDALDRAEGLSLLDLVTGDRAASLSATMLGRTSMGDPLLGLRTVTRGEAVKAVVDLASDEGDLYALSSDDGEARDLAPEQPQAMEQARRALAVEAAAVDALSEAPRVPPGMATRIEHLYGR